MTAFRSKRVTDERIEGDSVGEPEDGKMSVVRVAADRRLTDTMRK
jgi:hypothetical protein